LIHRQNTDKLFGIVSSYYMYILGTLSRGQQLDNSTLIVNDENISY